MSDALPPIGVPRGGIEYTVPEPTPTVVQRFHAEVGEGLSVEKYLDEAAEVVIEFGWLRGGDPGPRIWWATRNALVRCDTEPYLVGYENAGRAEDHYPFVFLWCLRLNGYLVPVDRLDRELYLWRMGQVSGEDHLNWLPCFPEHP